MQFPAPAVAQGVPAEGMHRLLSAEGLSQCPRGLILTASAHPPITIAERDSHEEVSISIYEG